ncbi:hypothetical protein AMJ71_09105 [candidate division TA06 bacterium SM1_40]|uniref:Uncharacterized protein n=1 Tax=candidate division TA06 bacterium SM1_40 TaxID=1703773 RepID=A0A0S8JD16_UNCT6|nr:MAG: hypothetical protein AMJ71_09105 [candidate division TA06 bacterium SM1_40]
MPRTRGGASIIGGVILIVVGLLYWARQTTPVATALTAWPIVLILVGLGLLASYWLKRKDPDLVFPGSFLVILGLFFLLWTADILPIRLDRDWPAILLAIGLSFFSSFLIQRSNWSLLVSGGGFCLAAFLFFGSTYGLISWQFWGIVSRFWPLVLIVLGAKIIYDHLAKGNDGTS